MLAAARDAGCRRFVHVSSLAGREPDLSLYGWSKAGAEAAVCDSASDWTVIRPPAVFGPGDTEMRDMFRLAWRGLAVIPWNGRLSVIYVRDLADLLIAAVAAGPDTHRRIYEADDGTPGGWAYRDFARAIGQAVGRPRVAAIPIPAPVLARGRPDRSAAAGTGGQANPRPRALYRAPGLDGESGAAPARRPVARGHPDARCAGRHRRMVSGRWLALIRPASADRCRPSVEARIAKPRPAA